MVPIRFLARDKEDLLNKHVLLARKKRKIVSEDNIK